MKKFVRFGCYRLAAALCFLFVFSGFAASSLPLGELAADRYMQHVSFLASHVHKGRGNGSPELERVAEYIASQFRSYGLRPAGDNNTYFQKFEIRVGSEFGSRNALQIAGASQRKDRDFVTMPISSSGTYAGPIVFAGYGITWTDPQWDDYAGIDVAGKAVLVFRHAPAEKDPNVKFAQAPSALAHFVSKANNARRRGARAILFVTDPNNHPDEKDTVGSATDELESQDMGILAMHVTRNAVAPLFEAMGKSMSGVQQAIDTNQKPQSFEFAGAKVRVVGDVRPIRKTIRNVLAAVPGSDPALKNEWIVIGAHYDHLGLGDGNLLYPFEVGKVHHGADDNASGTAGVLELARLMERNKQTFKRSILFMTFAGEELGMFGSNHFVSNPLVPLPSIAAMINLDMIGRLSGSPLNVMGIGTSPDFEAWITEANKDIGLPLELSSSAGIGSDHVSFDGHRIPTLSFFSGMHEDYHSPSDTSDKIDSKGAIQVLSIVAGAAERIAGAPSKPRYTEVRDERPLGVVK